MKSTSFACPICSGVFQVDLEQMASQVYCPLCGEVVDIPDTGGSPGNSPGKSASRKKSNTESKGSSRTASTKSSPTTLSNQDLFPPGYSPEPVVGPATGQSVTNLKPVQTPHAPTSGNRESAPSPLKPHSGDAHSSPAPLKTNLGSALLPQPTQALPQDPNSTGAPLLPPTTTAALPEASAAITDRPAKADHLLPPAVAAPEDVHSTFTGVGIDTAPRTDETPQIALLEPVKTIERGGQEIELKQRTPEAKLRWRRNKNVVMWIGGILILLITLYAMKN